MSYPPGFLFRPSVSSGLLARASPGSAFAPYPGPGASPGFSSPLPFGGEPRSSAALSPFLGPGFEPSGLSVDFHPFGALGPYPYGDPCYRKNATRDATATLKAWLQEHRKNPYPTKGEKIMLAIVTKMSLTQVSTWFANARRRLKKDNKMTWTPRTRSEDEDEDQDPERPHEEEESERRGGAQNRSRDVVCPSSAGDACDSSFRDFEEAGDGGRGLVPVAPPHPAHRMLGVSEPERVSGPSSEEGGAPKPKLWSLAEIATSPDRTTGSKQEVGGVTFPHRPSLSSHLYYTPPLVPGCSGLGPPGPPHAGSHLKGLNVSWS